MSYRVNVAEVCHFLIPASQDIELASFGEHDSAGFILKWDDTLGAKPTEQQVADAFVDMTSVSGQTFSQWQASRAADKVAVVTDKSDIKTQASQAIQDNDAYLALQSPTTAESIAQVRRLTQQNNRVIKALRRLV